MINAQWIPVDIQWTGLEKQRKQPAIPTRMLTKKEVREMVHMAEGSKSRYDLYRRLNTYANPYNKNAIYREEDVIDLLRNFPVVR